MFPLRPVFATLCLAAASYGADASLQGTFAKMDAVAPAFKGLTANLTQVTHTEVIHEDETDTGNITVKRPNPKDLRILMELKGANAQKARKAAIGGNKVQIYYPVSNLVNEYDLGKSGAMRDELMMIAFGSNSKDLVRAYTVSLGGPEAVAGQKATRIVLIPKNPELSKMFPKIELWIADETGLTLQQKLHEGGGDYLMATYSDIKLVNPADSAVKLNVPKNAKIERPQK